MLGECSALLVSGAIKRPPPSCENRMIFQISVCTLNSCIHNLWYAQCGAHIMKKLAC